MGGHKVNTSNSLLIRIKWRPSGVTGVSRKTSTSSSSSSTPAANYLVDRFAWIARSNNSCPPSVFPSYGHRSPFSSLTNECRNVPLSLSAVSCPSLTFFPPCFPSLRTMPDVLARYLSFSILSKGKSNAEERGKKRVVYHADGTAVRLIGILRSIVIHKRHHLASNRVDPTLFPFFLIFSLFYFLFFFFFLFLT